MRRRLLRVLGMMVSVAALVPLGATAANAVYPPCVWRFPQLALPGTVSCEPWRAIPPGTANYLKLQLGQMKVEGKVYAWADLHNPAANAVMPDSPTVLHGPDDIYVGFITLQNLRNGDGVQCDQRHWLAAGGTVGCGLDVVNLPGDLVKVEVWYLDRARKQQVDVQTFTLH